MNNQGICILLIVLAFLYFSQTREKMTEMKRKNNLIHLGNDNAAQRRSDYESNHGNSKWLQQQERSRHRTQGYPAHDSDHLRRKGIRHHGFSHLDRSRHIRTYNNRTHTNLQKLNKSPQ
jgi:hypothetical protein